ncbi:3-oxosteroid 1-dehydrogenase [Paraburkholderia sp. BL6669N2]|uniref:FAD-binding protein n=1 Tax=Paraburkholderia sp. BL6669N2 TaxID=1938807 RepID=UPI000E24E152|nr:FAD-binding protein [Paraburkholderia sp. BL6669N2]REG58466.1 3-oxosteroid 1-dehydrogenase [Paraburkholderia sp. BL6669N2]
MSDWDATYDFVVVGSGGGSMCAALACKTAGKEALIIEKQSKVGGSTGYSGGVWWLPNNHVMRRHGVRDSYERARQYFDAAVTYQGPGTSPARREAYLRTGPKMAEFLEQQGMQFVYADGWSDYYDTLPGGEPRGRSLLAKLFDVKELGEWAPKLSRYKGVSIPANSNEFPELFLLKRTWGGKRKAMQLAGRMLYQKLTGKELVSNGAAIQGRMLQIALRENIPIWTETPVRDLIVENGRVAGVIAMRGGREMRVRAREGVLLNTGGFSHNAEMRRKYQPQPSSSAWTNANPGDTGEVLEAAVAIGGAVDCMEEAWWVVTSLGPNETLPEGARAPDGSPLPFMHHLDLSLPFSIMVDQDGRRFCDEAGAYMEIGQRMYQRQKETGKAVPSWVVMDSRQRKYYPWGTAMQGQIPQQWLDSGYMIKADSISELAQKCGIDTAGLQDTVTRFNGFCKSGVDSDYGRGSRAFDRCHGDPTIKPNPNLGPIEQAPFYAVRMYPGDVGTAGGLVTDEYARVLKEDGSLIPGLYATGNCTASVVGRCYPGAGSSIGASFVFGYIAALHASGAQTIW